MTRRICASPGCDTRLNSFNKDDICGACTLREDRRRREEAKAGRFKPEPMSREEREHRIRELYEEGLSIISIAAELGISNSTVERALGGIGQTRRRRVNTCPECGGEKYRSAARCKRCARKRQSEVMKGAVSVQRRAWNEETALRALIDFHEFEGRWPTWRDYRDRKTYETGLPARDALCRIFGSPNAALMRAMDLYEQDVAA